MAERGRTKYTVLGMLAIEDMSGYEITKAIQSSTHYFWSESMGQIYPALAQCLKEGLIVCKETSQSKREKKIYAITTFGKKELASWLKKEAQPAWVRNELLLKLFFGSNVEKEININHILHQQKQLEDELETYKEIKAGILKQYKKSADAKYWLITLNYGLKAIKAELAWCKETLTCLKA